MASTENSNWKSSFFVSSTLVRSQNQIDNKSYFYPFQYERISLVSIAVIFVQACLSLFNLKSFSNQSIQSMGCSLTVAFRRRDSCLPIEMIHTRKYKQFDVCMCDCLRFLLCTVSFPFPHTTATKNNKSICTRCTVHVCFDVSVCFVFMCFTFDPVSA